MVSEVLSRLSPAEISDWLAALPNAIATQVAEPELQSLIRLLLQPENRDLLSRLDTAWLRYQRVAEQIAAKVQQRAARMEGE